MDSIGISPVSNGERMLHTLGTKFASGKELTMSERLIAMTAATHLKADYYGPGPADMRVSGMDLPENIKGMLISYAG